MAGLGILESGWLLVSSLLLSTAVPASLTGRGWNQEASEALALGTHVSGHPKVSKQDYYFNAVFLKIKINVESPQ